MEVKALIKTSRFRIITPSDITRIRQAGFGILLNEGPEAIVISGKLKKIKRFCRNSYLFQICEATIIPEPENDWSEQENTEDEENPEEEEDEDD